MYLSRKGFTEPTGNVSFEAASGDQPPDASRSKCSPVYPPGHSITRL